MKDVENNALYCSLLNINERFIFDKTPAKDGFAYATFIQEVTRYYLNGSGVISADPANGLSELIPVNKETDALHVDLDLSVVKVSFCMHKNGTWVKNSTWLYNTDLRLFRFKDYNYDFDAIRVQYCYVNNRNLTAQDDILFMNGVSIRQGVDTFADDFDAVKSNVLTYIPAIANISVQANRLLANINDNVVFAGSPLYFDDTPTGHGGSFINLRYTSSYNEQLFIESVSGHMYERVVSREGVIYRNWTLDTRTRFFQKKVYCTGDSIMWGRTDENGRASLTIPNNIKARFPVTVTNNAVGGDTIAHREGGASVYDRITAVDLSSYDYVVLNGGTNDYGYGVEFGTIDSEDVSTFYGAYKAILEYILGQNPYMRIMLITPTFRNYVARGGQWRYGNSYTMPGDGGYTMNEMCDAIIAIGKRYNVPVFDSRRNSPINEVNYETTLELTAGSIDRYLHLSDRSYVLYGDAIASFFADVF